MRILKMLLMLIWILGVLPVTATGQDLTYQPKNPAFGGHYLNYSWMMSSADAQNTFKDPDQAKNQLEQDDLLASFSESLNRQLLNQLSRDIIESQFGEMGLTEGSYVFGDFQVEVAPGFDGLTITIFDLRTGGQTQLTIPYY